MTEQLPAIVEVREELSPLQNDFRAMLPAHISPEKFQQTVITALERDPTLLLADRQSLFVAAKEAAQDGLLPDKKEGAFVVYNVQQDQPTGRGHAVQKVWVKMARWMPMVYGVRKKMFQTGQVQDMQVELVYEHDEYRREAGDNALIHHVPLDFGDRGKLRGGYAIIRLKDGGAFREVMTIDQINAVEGISKATSGPWKGPFKSEMQRKTILRRLAKQVPMTSDVERVLARDDGLYNLDAERTVFLPPERPSIPKSALFSNRAAIRERPVALDAPAATQGEPVAAETPPADPEEPPPETDVLRLVTAIRHAEDLGTLVELAQEAGALECDAEERAWLTETMDAARVRLMPTVDEIEGGGEGDAEQDARGPFNRDQSAGGEPSPEAGPQAEASLAGTGTGMPADYTAHHGEGPGDGDEDRPPAPVLRALITSGMAVKEYTDPREWADAILSKLSSVTGDRLHSFWRANAAWIAEAKSRGEPEAYRVLKIAAGKGLRLESE